ncbi:MAG: LysE family translocator [Muribaculaceae bacterium]|nr:LysE family translocator [Muribaculaceae bacterium]
MGFFESLFYTLWRGLAIGVLISAPMGPVGILCIQRTLYKGRKTGLYTGIGAAISDLIYCILTGFGLSFIEEFIERNQNVIQLAGSAVLIAFAIYLFKKNPASSLKTPQGEQPHVSPHKNILGGFFFTFSNPLILFLIIGLFARFNFTIPEINFYYYIGGYIAIFCGALLWWEFVTFTVNKLRAHFNLRSMWLINRIIGVIILIFAVVGIVTGASNLAKGETIHWNKGRGYQPFIYSTPAGIKIENESDTLKYDYYALPRLADGFTLRFRACNINGNPKKRYTYITQGKKTLRTSNPHWGFFITLERDTIAVTVKSSEKVTAIETIPAVEISVYNLATGEKKRIVRSEKINPYNGDNLWEIRKEDGKIEISGGESELPAIFTSYSLNAVTGFGFFAGWGDSLLVSDIDVDYETPDTFISNIPLVGLEEYLSQSEDEMEGYWTIFDRDLEESLLKLGGSYTLVCLKSDEDSATFSPLKGPEERGAAYYFVYIDGASVNSRNWNRGDVKVILKPTPFEGIYDVEWRDAMKQTMDYDLKAQIGEGNTLSIQFPYQSSKLRLRKIP